LNKGRYSRSSNQMNSVCSGDARAITALAGIGILVRIAIGLVYSPALFLDSPTYFTLAEQLRTADFSRYIGLRTPGYPLMLILCGSDPQIAVLAQAALGVATSILLYMVARQLSAGLTIAFLSGLIHSLSLNVLFFEASVLTEALSAFLVVLSVWLFMGLPQSKRPTVRVACLGFVLAFATLTRPVLVCLGPVYCFLLVWLGGWRAWRQAATLGTAFASPVLGWVIFNQLVIGYFGLSTLLGISLTNHVGAFIERAPEQYAQVRDIYLKHRAEKVAETGSHAMTIFLARDEMMQELDMTFPQLSRTLTKLSTELIVAHPLLYARSVAEAWVSFWAAPLAYQPDSFSSPSAAPLVLGTWRIEQPLIRVLNLGFVLASTAWLLVALRPRNWRVPIVWNPLAPAIVVWSVSVTQALLEFGDNPRYGVPTQSLAILFLLSASNWGVQRHRAKPSFARRS